MRQYTNFYNFSEVKSSKTFFFLHFFVELSKTKVVNLTVKKQPTKLTKIHKSKRTRKLATFGTSILLMSLKLNFHQFAFLNDEKKIQVISKY